MTSVGWLLVDVVSQLLQPDEREAVCGDLVEAGENAWEALFDLLGLVVRREAAVWRSWQPWLAAFGLALPGSLLLMGASMSASWMYLHFVTARTLHANGLTGNVELFLLISQAFLLIGWSWTGGFVVGSLSRRTLWASIAASCVPCLFCLARFQERVLPSPCLFLFLVPAIWGGRRGLRTGPIKLSAALILAVAITVSMIPAWGGRGLWIVDWALIWPAWYVVGTARRPTWYVKQS